MEDIETAVAWDMADMADVTAISEAGTDMRTGGHSIAVDDGMRMDYADQEIEVLVGDSGGTLGVFVIEAGEEPRRVC